MGDSYHDNRQREELSVCRRIRASRNRFDELNLEELAVWPLLLLALTLTVFARQWIPIRAVPLET